MTMNEAMRSHHMKIANMTEEWRGVFHFLALEAKVPTLDEITVIVRHELKNKAHMPDIGACMPSAKAAIDGLIDAGVIDDDDPEHLVALTLEPPKVTGRHALVLEISEVLDPSSAGSAGFRSSIQR
jgi:hypothetical protein